MQVWHDMIDIPHKNISSDQRLNYNEFIEFDKEIDGMTGHPYGIKLISTASDTSPGIY